MPLDKDDARMLCALAVKCRPHGAPRWDPPGIMAALEKVRGLALPDVMAAVARAASDKDARTPGVIAATSSHHWREKVAPSLAAFPAKAGSDCRVHPGKDALSCTACAADRIAGDPVQSRPGSAPPPPDFRERVRAADKQAKETP